MSGPLINNRTAGRTASHYVMICSLAVAAIVCYAHVAGSSVILLFGLISFIALAAWAGNAGYSIHVLLFFLPWSPLIKFSRYSFALFTIALLMICMICLVKNRFNINYYQITIPGLLVIETLIAKVIQENSLSNSYMFFMAMLVLFPCVMDETVKEFSFYDITVFFAAGIISSALTAQRIAGYPNISAFITVDSYQMITRLSGFYGDPNFYAAQITACFAGIQLLLIIESERRRRILLSVMAMLLFYCGMLSASKTFVIVFAVQMFIWTVLILDRDNRGRALFRILAGVVIASAIILSSSEFTRLFQLINERLSFSANASEITTHRTDLWMMYLNELTRNPVLALLGEGYTNVNLNGRASHNTLIQGVYQFGIIGFPLLFVWMRMSIKKMFINSGRKFIEKKYGFLMVTGVMMPWLSLDILFFDEFFLLPLYAGCAVIYSSER